MKSRNDIPIFMAASSFTEGLKNIEKCFQCGVGGVVTKTIWIGDKKERKRESIYVENFEVYNSTTYSRYDKQMWIQWLEELCKQKKRLVIPNIWGDNIEKIVDYIIQLDKIGIKIVELGISCPNDKSRFKDNEIYQIIHSALSNTSIDISVKLVADNNVVSRVEGFVNNGIKHFTISDTFPGCYLKNNKVLKVGYSGRAIKPLVLNKIAEIKSAFPDVVVYGTGGIQTIQDIQDYFKIGADLVQLCSIGYVAGYEGIKKVVSDYRDWRSVNEYL